MEALSCRLLAYTDAAGAVNMAADEILLRSAAERDLPALRLYGWQPATLSLGYFQPASVRLEDPRLASLAWVRRPSGGATLVHHHELTYALALPARLAQRAQGPWMAHMHRIIARALAELGLARHIEQITDPAAKHGPVLCFQHFTPGDLLCNGKKVVGSAQRKYHQALLQHGSILLAQSEHTPMLPGIHELTGTRLTVSALSATLLRVLRDDTGWPLESNTWSVAEEQAIAALAHERYASQAWNARR